MSIHGHSNYQVSLEYTLELLPPVESQVLVEATVSLFTDPCYEMDADGNRGTWRTEINSVEVHSLRLYFPDRPTILAAGTYDEVRHFLTPEELDVIVDMVCEKAFMEYGFDLNGEET